MVKAKSEKTQSDRAEMFSLLAGGLDDKESASDLTASPAEAEAPTEAPREPASDLQPVVKNNSGKQVDELTGKQVNESTGKRKRRAKTGKRSDDAYMQTGMFLPVELVQAVKGYLAFDGDRQTIGELTEGLLQAWAAEKKDELAKRLSQ